MNRLDGGVHGKDGSIRGSEVVRGVSVVDAEQTPGLAPGQPRHRLDDAQTAHAQRDGHRPTCPQTQLANYISYF